jgi:hypothetical protein
LRVDAEAHGASVPHCEKSLLIAIGFTRSLRALHLRFGDQVEREHASRKVKRGGKRAAANRTSGGRA